VLLRRRLGTIELRESATAFVRIVAASVVAGAVGYGVWRGLDEELGRGLAGQIVSIGTALLAATGAYGLACRALGVHELRALLSLRRRQP
jgi:peptidoglycan biosynthesis protein MviN/MurJ (putative lipid II flippase)